MMSLRGGDLLEISKNDETCTVLNAREVSYQREA